MTYYHIIILFYLIITLAFVFCAFFDSTIKTKVIVQIAATVILALNTVGVGFFWLMIAVTGAGQQFEHDMRNGDAEFGFVMLIYYSPFYIAGLWIVDLIIVFKNSSKLKLMLAELKLKIVAKLAELKLKIVAKLIMLQILIKKG